MRDQEATDLLARAYDGWGLTPGQLRIVLRGFPHFRQAMDQIFEYDNGRYYLVGIERAR